MLGLFLLGSCAAQEKNWITANGKYGQTWVNGVLLMEIEYKSTLDCLKNVNHEINENNELQRKLFIEKSFRFICSEEGYTREPLKLEPNGLFSATGGLTYQGFFRFATSAEKYVVRFPMKQVCEMISSDLKLKNSNQDLICP